MVLYGAMSEEIACSCWDVQKSTFQLNLLRKSIDLINFCFFNKWKFKTRKFFKIKLHYQIDIYLNCSYSAHSANWMHSSNRLKNSGNIYSISEYYNFKK